MKPKKIVCLILSLLFIASPLCFASCDSANVGDLGGDQIGGLSTDETQETDENKVPLYTAPAKYKEIAKSDKVYHSGIYTGYSIIIKDYMYDEHGQSIGSNLNEVMLKYPGEALPVHEDPTCSHDSDRCPTAAESMSKTFLIVDQDDGLPVVFYFGLYWGTVYSEEKGEDRPARIVEIRGYDVETGEYTTVAEISRVNSVQNAILYKGKIYFTCDYGSDFCMVDILTGETKVVESEDEFFDYKILDIVDDRLYYVHSFGEWASEENPDGIIYCELRSCSLDLDDVKTEYSLVELGKPEQKNYSRDAYNFYMDGSTVYFPVNFRYAIYPEEICPDIYTVYTCYDFRVYDIYALDLNDISAGERLILKDAYKFAAKNGKLYYTLVDYKEVGEVRFFKYYTAMFASTDGGTLYEYDTATGTTREVFSDSGYSIYGIYEITDDGKMFFDGTDYVNFVPAEEGGYSSDYYVGRKEYCMLDLSTGKITELYAPLRLEDPEEGMIDSCE